MISRILFTGDSFRTTVGEPNQITNVAWIEDLFSDLLSHTTDLPTSSALPIAGRTMTEFIALQGGEPTLDGWARVFWSQPSGALIKAVHKACNGALVVGFEMPPVMTAALDAADIHWIDITISPLRFLPDWPFHIRASHHFDIESIKDAALQQSDIDAAIAHVTNWYGQAPISEPTRVFFAQTARDRTLIRGNRFCTPENLQGLDTTGLLIKPHPGEPDTEITRYLKSRGAVETHLETYALLANPLVEVVTLSSSVGREARAFGRKVTTLNPEVQDWTYSGVDVMRDWISQRYWVPLLESAGIRTRKVMGPSWTPNLLRKKHGGQGLSMNVWA